MLFSSVLTLTMFLSKEATAVDWPELPSSKTVESMLAGASASDAAKIAQGQLSNDESMRIQQSIQLRTELKRELKKSRYRKSHKHDRVVLIGLEEYAYLSGISYAGQTIDDWQAYFRAIGVPKSQISVLKNEDATAEAIADVFETAAKKLPKVSEKSSTQRAEPWTRGRLWVVYIGHGLTSFKENVPALVPYDAEPTARELYNSALPLTQVSEVIEKARDRSVFILDTSFNGVDRFGAPLSTNIPVQNASTSIDQLQSILGRNSAVITTGEGRSPAGLLTENARPALSYLMLGGIRGWSDSNADGWVTLEEAVSFSNEHSRSGARLHSTVGSRSQRTLKLFPWIESGPKTKPDPIISRVEGPESFVPMEFFQDGIGLNELLGNLEEQRRFEVEVQSVLNEESVGLLAGATEHWKKVTEFVAERVDDPARVAVFAYVKEYEGLNVTIDGQSYPVEVPELVEARQLLKKLATPVVHGQEFSWIERGNFSMGSPEKERNRDEEEVEHLVQLSHSFYISKTEVTQAMYVAVMGDNPSTLVGDSLPVTNVSWRDALIFANKLSISEELEPCYELDENDATGVDGVRWTKGYDCLGYRLPSEAEWEYSSKAGQKHIYSGSDKIDDVAWVESNSAGTIHSVAKKKPNKNGLYDMSGNVWEWVWDSYGSYPTDPVVDPAGPFGFGQATDQLNLAQLLGSTTDNQLSPASASTNQYRIRRGGSVEHVPRYARNAYRVRAYPTYKSYDLGLRLVRSTPPDEQSAD